MGYRKLALCMLGIVLCVGYLPAQAQADWSEPLLLYRTNYSVTNPLVAADIYGTVHVFWVEFDRGNGITPAIFHTEYREAVWSAPASILVTPGGGSIAGLQVTTDRQGTMHAIWQGPGNSLYYTSAHASQAGNPHNWRTPVALATSFTYPGLAVDAQQGVYIAYPTGSADAVYLLKSSDSGSNWGAPQLVSYPVAVRGGINYTSLAIGPDETIYIAWTEFQLPDGWPPTGVYVSTSTDGGITWSVPKKLAGGGYDQINLAVSPDGVVYVSWNGMIGVGGRYVSYSGDRGQGWSAAEAVVPPGLGGTSGYPRIVFDSSAGVHFVTTFDMESGGGIHYAYYNQGQWSTLQWLSTGFNRTDYVTYSIELPDLAISQGNRLHVVYEVGFEEIYYQTSQCSAPGILPEVYTPRPTHTPGDPDGEMAAEASPTEGVIGTAGQSFLSANPNLAILAAALPVLMILLVVALRVMRRSR